MKWAIAVLLAALTGCVHVETSNDVFNSSSVPDMCDPQGECNVGKRL